MKVENFGQVVSKPAEVALRINGKEIASATVPAIQPFEDSVVQLNCPSVPSNKKETVTVVIKLDGTELSSFSTP